MADPRCGALRFALATYYALFLKLLADAIAAAFARPDSPPRYLAQDELFAWHLDSQSAAVHKGYAALQKTLAAYDSSSLRLSPAATRDLPKRLYQQLFPKALRHLLGEYYTPDWLADFTLTEVGYTGDPQARLLDPTCGSGTFLVQAIGRIRAGQAKTDAAGDRALAQKIVRNVVGWDKNPLAVLAARTNYLLALGDLLRFVDPAALPVFVADATAAAVPEPRFDYVVGNPPWINWAALPAAYRQHTAHLWRDYGLLTLSGWKARVAAGRTDLSILLLAISVKNYVADHGRLAFVITQSIFKSAGGGAGLRRFLLAGTPFAPLRVHDFSAVTVFPDAVTRVAVGIFQRDTVCSYPVPYVRWEPRTRRPPAVTAPRCDLMRIDEQAVPASAADPLSPWLTSSVASLGAMRKLFGPCAYRAREGINWGGALGVFQLATAQPGDDALCTIRNDASAGRSKVAATTAQVEQALVYPLVKGRDVKRWHAELSRSVILSHPEPTPDARASARPMALPTMQRHYPHALAYFSQFRALLTARKEYQRWGGKAPFYELYRIGPYTFSPCKVVFKDLSEIFQCCVVTTAGPQARVVICDYTLRMIPCASADEALFVAGLLNSSPVGLALHASASGVQTRRYHASDISKLALPAFAPALRLHLQVVALSRACHRAAATGSTAAVAALEAELDAAVSTLWQLSPGELLQLQTTFKALVDKGGRKV